MKPTKAEKVAATDNKRRHDVIEGLAAYDGMQQSLREFEAGWSPAPEVTDRRTKCLWTGTYNPLYELSRFPRGFITPPYRQGSVAGQERSLDHYKDIVLSSALGVDPVFLAESYSRFQQLTFVERLGICKLFSDDNRRQVPGVVSRCICSAIAREIPFGSQQNVLSNWIEKLPEDDYLKTFDLNMCKPSRRLLERFTRTKQNQLGRYQDWINVARDENSRRDDIGQPVTFHGILAARLDLFPEFSVLVGVLGEEPQAFQEPPPAPAADQPEPDVALGAGTGAHEGLEPAESEEVKVEIELEAQNPPEPIESEEERKEFFGDDSLHADEDDVGIDFSGSTLSFAPDEPTIERPEDNRLLNSISDEKGAGRKKVSGVIKQLWTNLKRRKDKPYEQLPEEQERIAPPKEIENRAATVERPSTSYSIWEDEDMGLKKLFGAAKTAPAAGKPGLLDDLAKGADNSVAPPGRELTTLLAELGGQKLAPDQVDLAKRDVHGAESALGKQDPFTMVNDLENWFTDPLQVANAENAKQLKVLKGGAQLKPNKYDTNDLIQFFDDEFNKRKLGMGDRRARLSQRG